VLVNDINTEAAQAVVDEILTSGGRAVVNRSDITNYESSGEAVKQALDTFGDLHAVVNNAGNNRDRMFASLSEADWDAVMAVHLKGHFCIASHAVQYWRHQVKSGVAVSGRLVNTTSGAGLQGSVGQSNYAAAKAGVIMFSRSCGDLHEQFGIRVNAVCPGVTETPILEKTGGGKRPDWLEPILEHIQVLTPEDIGQAVINIISDDAMAGEFVVVQNQQTQANT